jgi:hypothetical protein
LRGEIEISRFAINHQMDSHVKVLRIAETIWIMMAAVVDVEMDSLRRLGRVWRNFGATVIAGRGDSKYTSPSRNVFVSCDVSRGKFISSPAIDPWPIMI